MTNVPTAVLVKLLRTVANAMTEAANELHKLSAPESLTPPRPAEPPRPPIPSVPPPPPR